MDTSQYQRTTAYATPIPAGTILQAHFLNDSGNWYYKTSFLTWVNLGILLIGYPALSLLGSGEDSASLLQQLGKDKFLLMFTLVTTILLQWFIFAINYGGAYVERTGLRGLGLKRIRGVDFAWAIAFLLVSNLLLAGLAWGLDKIGLPMPGEIGFLIPKDLPGQMVWVAVSFTAGFCEEIAFRGYLMTRLRLIFGNKTWLIPTIISAITFGVCHAYQGLPGLIVISTYGLLFSLLYIRTGTLWPCIIAHFFQDFGALFFPH